MIDPNNWLNINLILRNEIFGDSTLLIIFFLIGISYFCMYTKMPFQLHLIFIILFGYLCGTMFNLHFVTIISSIVISTLMSILLYQILSR